MSDSAQQYWDQLAELGLLPSLHGVPSSVKETLRRAANENADNPALLKAVLCAGLFPNVLKVGTISLTLTVTLTPTGPLPRLVEGGTLTLNPIPYRATSPTC